VPFEKLPLMVELVTFKIPLALSMPPDVELAVAVLPDTVLRIKLTVPAAIYVDSAAAAAGVAAQHTVGNCRCAAAAVNAAAGAEFDWGNFGFSIFNFSDNNLIK